MLKISVALGGILLTFNSVFAQADEASRGRNKPVPPFRIAGNLYYVGAIEIGNAAGGPFGTRRNHRY